LSVVRSEITVYVNAMTVYYLGRRLRLARVPVLPRICETVGYLVFNCSIPVEADIGPGCRCNHRGVGVVIHKTARIGAGCTFHPGVVIGVRWGGESGAPNVGDDVIVGAGAKLIGPVTVGDGAVIGANAVVLENVPAHSVAVGVPARVVTPLPDESLGSARTV
jgi:serine O-acetyltransferase